MYVLYFIFREVLLMTHFMGLIMVRIHDYLSARFRSELSLGQLQHVPFSQAVHKYMLIDLQILYFTNKSARN